jgi:hypothetical protein
MEVGGVALGKFRHGIDTDRFGHPWR